MFGYFEALEGLKKVGIPADKSVGRVVGEDAPKQSKPAETRSAAPPANDFMAQLNARMKKTTANDTGPRSNEPRSGPKAVFNVNAIKKAPPLNTQTQPTGPSSGNSGATVNKSENEIQKMIREEIEKMKREILVDFRQIIREELQNCNL